MEAQRSVTKTAALVLFAARLWMAYLGRLAIVATHVNKRHGGGGEIAARHKKKERRHFIAAVSLLKLTEQMILSIYVNSIFAYNTVILFTYKALR